MLKAVATTVSHIYRICGLYCCTM